eukprot:COSAG01_NODE_68784_length_263_cov_0.628049_1_plen_63_part_01
MGLVVLVTFCTAAVSTSVLDTLMATPDTAKTVHRRTQAISGPCSFDTDATNCGWTQAGTKKWK